MRKGVERRLWSGWRSKRLIMEGEIFEFDAENEHQKDTSGTRADGLDEYTLAHVAEHDLADAKRMEKGEHDYNDLQEGRLFEYLNNGQARGEGRAGAPGAVQEGGKEEAEDEEEAYDRYVPTDKNTVDEYLRQLEEENAQEEVNLKAKHVVRCEHDGSKIRFSKGIIGMYVPPENFARVCEGIYRSSFPRIENFEFLRNLKLKSILCLIPEEYPVENTRFNEANKIAFFQIGLSGNKEPFVKIKPGLVTEAIKILIDPQNQPVLIHCNRGKHRTGCIVGCIRKLQKWSHSMIFDEYRRFAYPKERPLDQQFIEMYNGEEVEDFAIKHSLLPIQW